MIPTYLQLDHIQNYLTNPFVHIHTPKPQLEWMGKNPAHFGTVTYSVHSGIDT